MPIKICIVEVSCIQGHFNPNMVNPVESCRDYYGYITNQINTGWLRAQSGCSVSDFKYIGKDAVE